jgi:hypothetical protein
MNTAKKRYLSSSSSSFQAVSCQLRSLKRFFSQPQTEEKMAA